MESQRYTAFFNNPSVEYLKINNHKSKFIVCGYYWGENNINKNSIKKLTYGQQIKRLVDNCEKLNLNYYFARYDNFEGILYQEAISLKPLFVKKCLNDSRLRSKTIMLVDTDLQIVNYPHLFEIEADCFFLNWSDIKTECYNPFLVELSGGIMGFGNTHSGRVLLNILIDSVIHNLQYAEDKVFSKIFTKHLLNVYTRCVWLPTSYLYMYQYHTYIPGKGYTKIVDLETDLRLSEEKYYKSKDIVVIHEDFETGALEDVYKQKVSKNRVPYDYEKALGRKLRCPPYNFKFNFYWNYGLSKEQYKQLIPGIKYKLKHKIFNKVDKIKKIKIRDCKENFRIVDQNLNNDSKFIVITEKSNETELLKIDLERLGIGYAVFEPKRDVLNKALAIYYTIKRTTGKNVVFLDSKVRIKKYPELFETSQIDFMTFNKNDIDLEYKKCVDPRVLETVNDELYVFGNTNISKQFLCLWNMFSDKTEQQHKNLEYIFNKSISINKLRCFWLPKTYLEGNVIKCDTVYSIDKSPDYIRYVRNKLVQCGIRGPLDEDGFEKREHYRNSTDVKRITNKFKQKFINS